MLKASSAYLTCTDSLKSALYESCPYSTMHGQTLFPCPDLHPLFCILQIEFGNSLRVLVGNFDTLLKNHGYITALSYSCKCMI